MIAPYKIHLTTREFYRDEVLISTLNPKNLKGVERKLFNHELIYLNPNYKGEDTPQNYRDWLDLIYESIHHSENPVLNIANEGVKRASELISYENIDPYEWEAAKFESMNRQVIKLEREEVQIAIAVKLFKRGFSDEDIAEDTGLTLEEIKELRTE